MIRIFGPPCTGTSDLFIIVTWRYIRPQKIILRKR